jgi:hypothetical protein
MLAADLNELASVPQHVATDTNFFLKTSWLSLCAALEKLRSLKFVVAAKCQGTP